MPRHSGARHQWLPYGAALVVLHAAGILFLLSDPGNRALLTGIGLIAYTLGLRHAFDADHIAAIDNTVRKLMQQDTNPTGVGFFFSLGHSSVVFVMAVITAVAVHWAQQNLPQLEKVGGFIGLLVSGCFLLLIGIINIAILFGLYKQFLKFRKGLSDEEQIERMLMSRGFIARFVAPLFKFVNKSWHVYPIGFLFGLGFDTASEVALLAISAEAAKHSISFTGILSLPILFAAGMSLMDTADGIFMQKAYDWAFSTPLRKIYYNLTLTAVSVAAALLIGGIELMQVLSSKLRLQGAFWQWVAHLNFGWLGYGLVVLFLSAWLISYGIWRLFQLEKRWGSKEC